MKKQTDNKNIKTGEHYIEMVFVEGGHFAVKTANGRYNKKNTKEIQTIELGDFWMAKTPVTDALWDAVMQDSRFPSESNLPKVNVKFSDTQRFIDKLNGLNLVGTNGLAFRLPFEAEWEYAARGGRTNRGFQYSGSNKIDDVAWYWDNSIPTPIPGSHFYIGEPEVHIVKEKRPNELGLYDMSGNVWEWCVADDRNNVCRGGCYDSEAEECTMKARFLPDVKKDYRIGFRPILAPIDNKKNSKR